MLHLQLSSHSAAATTIDDAMFGANVVFKVNTDNGDVEDSFAASAKVLGINHLRFPAGQGDNLNPASEGVDWLNIVTLENGALRPELTVFLDWCAAQGIKATLVLPTKHLPTEAYSAFAEDIREFASLVLDEYADVVDAFEIGNEYWAIGETAYAAHANMAIDAIAKGAADAGVALADLPDILVQMATPNTGSEFHANAPGMAGLGFTARLEMANHRLIDLLSEPSRSMIDGLVEHYYYARTETEFTGDNNEMNYIGRDIAIWNERLSGDLDVHITEWNVKTTNIAQNGIRSASTILYQFDRMLEMGVDAASIWAVQHNTTTDLTGNNGAAVLVDDAGRVINTIRGAVFDLMSEQLPGLSRLEMEFDSPSPKAAVQGYGSQDKLVVYVSSRSLNADSFSLDIGDLAAGLNLVSGTVLGYDASSSDGYHFNPNARKFTAADGLDLNGDGALDYFINEHDVRAKFTDYAASDLIDAGLVSFDLDPFEVMQLVFESDGGAMKTLRGGSSEDTILGTEGNDFILGLSGDDHLTGAEGDDILRGGRGNDTLAGSEGADRLVGKQGADLLKGQLGDDVLLGKFGEDRLLGGAGQDRLWGGKHNDHLSGEKGRDVLHGGAGHDLLNGGADRDVLNGNAGNDTLVGGSGGDTFVFSGGHDVAQDFETGVRGEKIDLSGVKAITGYEDLMARHIEQTGGDVVISDLLGNSLTLLSVDLDDLIRSDFIF